MYDENNRPAHPSDDHSDELSDQIDDLLPVPSDTADTDRDDVDSSMDTLLPMPGEESHSRDDATTREELEVDTSNDDIDDVIPLNQSSGGDPNVSSSEVEENPTIAGEHVTWQEVPEFPIEDDDNHPINEDSDFYVGSYAAPNEATTAESLSDSQAAREPEPPTVEPEITHQCRACGATIGKAPYCSQCGTDQYPESRLSVIFTPLLSWSRPLAIRAVLLVSGLLALLALLADSGANALVISAIAIPVVLLVRMELQLRSHTPTGWVTIGIMAMAGLIIGSPLAWLAARMVKRSWFDTGVLNFGAAGFGGNFAEAAGVAPFFVWLVVGVLIPVVVVLAISAVPIGWRMVTTMAPRESRGMMLSGAVAAGYVIASAIMFYRPLFTEMAPRMTTSQWTLTIFGLGVIRPMVWIFGGAMIGAVVWRFLRTASPASVTIPAVIAAVVPFGFSILSLAAGPAGHWAETVVGLAFAVAASFLYHRFLPTAIRHDAALKTVAK